MSEPWSVGKAARGVGLLLVVGFLAWRALVANLADYYANQDTTEDVVGALRWQARQPEALYQRGVELAASDPTESERLLRLSAWADPTDALVYLALAAQWAGAGRVTVAAKLVEIADILGPWRGQALARSAAFWQAQGQQDRALALWSKLLRVRPALSEQLFPLLLQLAEAPASRALLQPMLNDPPKWWDSFFTYVAAKAIQLETVTFLYHNRNRYDDLPSADEQRAYLNRLWQEKRWQDAYLAWLSGLDEGQIKVLGNLYNGSFEAPVTQLGFDWRIQPSRAAKAEIVETYGTGGGKALHVTFNGERIHFQHVGQYLFLNAGHYRLQGRGRPEGLKTERGIRWRVRCVGDAGDMLAESEPFVGSDEWRNFAVDFVVPDQECPAQLLRLELDGRAELDFEADGGVWFDKLAIVRLD